jgi:opacity protein-like surface antigen
MKKIVLIGALVVAFQITYAQITLIPKAGLTSSTVKTKVDEEGIEIEVADTKIKLGFTVGVGLNIPITKAFSLQPELNFIQKGFSSEWDSDEEGIVIGTLASKSKLTLNYLELPLLAKYTFNISKSSTQFFVEAGPSLALGVGGKAKIDNVISDGNNSTKISGEYKVKFGSDELFDIREAKEYPVENRTDVGLQLGAGTVFSNRIMIDLRYTFGMTNLYDVEGVDISIKNRVLQLTVGMPLALKK